MFTFYKLNQHDIEPEPKKNQSKDKRTYSKFNFWLRYSIPKKIEKKIYNKYKKRICEDENERMPSLSQIQIQKVWEENFTNPIT